ncbi:phage terminase small subunit [Vibrio clamense]|uniref:phage terminase small subunit n=1 Tax=Vibrio clamense TaxID=2910254 RepID=UPI003D2131A8
MLSILMKRKAQATVQTEPERVSDEPGGVLNTLVHSTFIDRSWEDTQAMLKQDLARVRTLSGSKEKDPYKESLIDKYRPLVEQLRDTHKGDYGNLDVMWWFYLWHVDLNKFEDIHDDFRAAIDAGLETPTNWKMNGQSAYCGYVFKYAHDAHTKKVAFKPDYLLAAVRDLLKGDLATNAPLKVKMFRLVGDWHFEAGEKEQAHNLFELVMKLDPDKGGRKTKLKDLKEALGYE